MNKIKHSYKFDGKKDGVFYWHCENCWKVRTTVEADYTECEKIKDVESP